MTAEQLIEMLKLYPPDVQVIIKIEEEDPMIRISLARPINNIYPSSFEDKRAICVCFESYEEGEEE